MRNFTKGLSFFVLIISLVAFNACVKDDDLMDDGGDESTCVDGIQNGNETGVDCGGDCAPCTTTPTCTDGIQNGNETGVDCGGNCTPCTTTTTPTCTDGIQNGNETGVDCGGDCAPCTTTPTCTDGIQNGNETGVDCGGDCPPCTTTPTCTDGIQNGNETGVDCGGNCPPCQVDPTCNDGIQNGDETGVDCGGSDCPPCGSNLVSMKDYISQNAQFSMLNEAIVRAGFDVESVGPNTFFAPNNDAWQALLTNNGWSSIDQVNANVLNTILQFQFSNTGAYTSDQFTNNFQITIMYQAKKVHIDMANPNSPRVVAGLSTATIVGADQMATNGVIHEIDAVLLF